MAGVFNKINKRFSIDDAFEEETETTVNAYGSTTETSPLRPKPRNRNGSDEMLIEVERDSSYYDINVIKNSNEALSVDSESMFHDGGYASFFDRSQWCCYHPRVRDNWKTVLAAAVLLVIGVGLLLTGLIFMISPDPNAQGIVFIIAGLICFIPGAYHVVYIYFAVIGKSGYDFNQLPLFN